MGYFKDLEIEIRELEFAGMTVQAIADHVGLSVKQVLTILDDIEDSVYYAEHATIPAAELNGNI